ncbi:hypothetical protein OCGS_0910 [Oceaniovalibus guishaninsula JLT2003]|uniref:Uncharacterized protein n=1 Tax=Oceaniovalibus guishaninsula JLT2003 TaxID=1231392 RepID=K2I776_9RHOB|nr:hypothetical protein [Oceaniovalibus guishaninsula]EKE44875.1 hypothetical protein OCGS_0910 [Oceaniovalibus guishaninsula JLT2003]
MDDANAAIRSLRAGTAGWSRVVSDAPMAGGIKLMVDPEARADIRLRSPAGRLMEIEARVERPGRWLGLHVPLALYQTAGLGIVGITARATAPEALAVSACLRSGLRGGFVDAFFDKAMAVHFQPLQHIDTMEPDRRVDLPARADWRELILFLPTHSFSLSLHDLRFFAA